jgi:uncharacterized protein (TIGR00375 family)
MKFLADLHIHSRFSLATAKKTDVESLYVAGRKKGIKVLGTGDFTHPSWFKELQNKLVEAENGLFKPKKHILKRCEKFIPEACEGTIRFIFSSEVCNIYKKGGKTIKIHNLILLPEAALVEKLNRKFSRLANLESNGRPVFTTDVIDILEMVFDVTEKALFVPAHIWTPWYSLFGSRSGFDSLEECFGKLSKYIFAVETGLSSDPSMCRNFEGLEGITLISNSDAHSPGKIGREANFFDTDLSYDGIFSAIKRGPAGGFAGTIEFHPEEGKYYADGHRKCNVSFFPDETEKHRGICPVCKNKLTAGVLSRIQKLSGKTLKKEKKPEHLMTIPLIEILSEVLGFNCQSKKLNTCYEKIITELGPELDILHNIEIERLNYPDVPLFAEAIKRMRKKKVIITPGFDGQFGSARLFEKRELGR